MLVTKRVAVWRSHQTTPLFSPDTSRLHPSDSDGSIQMAILLRILKGHSIEDGSVVWIFLVTRSISFLEPMTILALIFGNTTLPEKQVLESNRKDPSII